MQKLNAREYYVVVVTAIITIVLSILVGKELFSETSPFFVNSAGAFEELSVSYVINIGQSIIQLILSLLAFIFLLKKRRVGWITAFSIIFFYAALLSYIIGIAAIAKVFDGLFWTGVLVTVMVLLALLFLCIPSTLKKFNITKTAIIPVLFVLALLGTLYFIIPA